MAVEIKNNTAPKTGNFASGLMTKISSTVGETVKAAEKQVLDGARVLKESVSLNSTDLDAAKNTKLRKMSHSFPKPNKPAVSPHLAPGLGLVGGTANIISGAMTIIDAKSKEEVAKGLTNIAGGSMDVVSNGIELAGKTAPAALKTIGTGFSVVGAGWDAKDAIMAASNGDEVKAVESGLDSLAGLASASGNPLAVTGGTAYTATRTVMKLTGGDEKVQNFFYQNSSGAISDEVYSKLRQEKLEKFALASEQGDLTKEVCINRHSAVAARVEAREMVKTATGDEKVRLNRLLKELDSGIQYATQREAEYKGLI